LRFEDVLLTGLAPDGGLYIPESFPSFSKAELEGMVGLPYPELAQRVISPYLDDFMSDAELRTLLEATYAGFHHPVVAPLVQTGSQEWVMELFRGPTLAFKDFALQLLGQFLDRALAGRGEHGVIVGATSGDTGSAAIEGCRHSRHLDIFILHPHQRVSEVQRRQMTTVLEPHVHNIAVEGNFDDCQAMVKACFADQSFLNFGHRLIAVNSINWARILPQVVYYFHAALSLGCIERPIGFSVPTGNFGDVFAGYVARKMGLPVEQLVVATNANDILHRFMTGNAYARESLQHTLSPSMDIMVSSNFERLLFDLSNQDGVAIDRLMAGFAKGESLSVPEDQWQACRKLFDSCRVDDTETCATIAEVFRESGYLLDPHSAIGLRAARRSRKNAAMPMVCLATAHPAKFPEAIEKSGITQKPDLPAHLVGLESREERYQVLPNDLSAVQAWVKEHQRG
jgi:threonine synthase